MRITMKPSDVAKMLVTAYNARRPIMLHGGPGISKSSLVKQMTEALGIGLIDRRLCTMEPTDIAGVPWPDAKERSTTWCLPDFLPREPESKGVIFLDEFPQALLATQNSASQLILDRRVNDYKLPPGWVVFLAGNRKNDKAGIIELASHMKNRLIHILVEPDLDDWIKWGNNRRPKPIRTEILAFLRFKRDALYRFDPDNQAFPTPRSWEFASDILDQCQEDRQPDHIEHAFIAGTIGEGTAAEFLGFLRVCRNLPKVEDIFRDPDRTQVPQDVSTQYALAACLARVVKEENMPALVRYIGRMPDDMSVMCMVEAVKRNPALKTTAAHAEWQRKHKHVTE